MRILNLIKRARIPNPVKRSSAHRDEDLTERRQEQAKLKQTLADKRENDVRIARLEGAVRAITARARSLES